MNCGEVASNRSVAALANGVSGMRTPASDSRRAIVAITGLLIGCLMPNLPTDNPTLLPMTKQDYPISRKLMQVQTLSAVLARNLRVRSKLRFGYSCALANVSGTIV